MPASFLAWTRSLILVMTFSGPTRVGQLGDHDAGLARVELLDLDRRAGAEDAAAGLVRLPDAVEADDVAAGRQVGARDVLHQLLGLASGCLSRYRAAAMTSVRLCGAMFVAIPTAIPAVPLTSRFGMPAGRTSRLLLAAVVVGAEVDGVLVDDAHHGHRGLGQPALGVPVGGRGVVAAEAAEVAVAVDQRDPHRPRLGHPDQGVVDRGVAVRVQAAHHRADHLGALDVRAVRAQAHVVHQVQDAALDRLEAVAGVGQRARVDDAVGVLQVRAAHLLGDVDVDDVLFELFRRRRGRSAAAWWHAAGSFAVSCGFV